jgi:hypothetical protein
MYSASVRLQHNTEHNKTISTNRQIQLQQHLPNEMPRLPTEIHRTNRHYMYKQLQIIIAIQNTPATLNMEHAYGTITNRLDNIRTLKTQWKNTIYIYIYIISKK